MNWAVMMRLAAERFGVTPEAFWRLSLVEWRALTGRPEAAAMTRVDLERMAAAWPDEGRS